MTLVLVIDQAFPSNGWERAPSVFIMKAMLIVKESLLTTSLHFILATFLTDLCLVVSTNNALLDGGRPGDTFQYFLPPGP